MVVVKTCKSGWVICVLGMRACVCVCVCVACVFDMSV